ncbi:hypothetical protein CP532_1175 [Ophiocordyceps camponoti-leonardi (nom. inval.)]|nr:hypothetical protein CP532_1175 [Ophiocordyceps camponoti-leonardi (nom. inval.)]
MQPTCKTFDAEANGYGRGEAINAVYVKPLRECPSDGKCAGFNAPSVIAQEDLIRMAYTTAGIDDFSETAFVECHGTGTAVGDPVEATVIGNVFGGDKGVYIGSVKPNVGHSEGASGLTSLIKTVLALEHQVIPPNIKFNTPNPKIPFKEKNHSVPIEAVSWPRDRRLRASVNCFGMGGTNAHVILESASNFISTAAGALPESYSTDGDERFSQLLVFSANTAATLERSVQGLQDYLQHRPDALADLAYTLGARREHLAFRSASVVNSQLSVINASPTVKIPSPPPEVVMVFTGQGAQWPRMGAELYRSNSIFRRDHKIKGAVVFPAAGYIAMAGAALGQLGSSVDGYHVRNPVLDTAMVLSDLHPTEILLSLRKSHGSDWYDFNVSSHNGTTWIEHCYGQARSSHAGVIVDQNGEAEHLDRIINGPSWYQTLRRGGLEFGPAFQRIVPPSGWEEHSKLLDRLTWPKQRVLEIGAGTGGTTAQVVEHVMCSTYTFTDISAAFFPAAKERFKKHENFIYKTLDITKDPTIQGFEPESYDLIIAANVLHATPSLHETLVNIPDSLSLEDAATMPLAFSTVIYSLIDLAQMDKSQSILIHSASGGIGLAAVQLSKMVGATIYATVSSEEKAEYLVKTHGLARDHIFHSRDASFLTGIMKCVAEGGRIVNLGKAEAAEPGQLPLHLFKANTSYNVVDMMDYVRVKPREGNRLLVTIVNLYQQGHVQPISPARTFSAQDIIDCLKCIQSGQHMGKLRVSFKQQPNFPKPAFHPQTMTFPENASYLLVGGLGGLGAGLARWMADRNAKHLIFLSRSAGEDADSYGALCHELKSQGCSVTTVRGSVCSPEDVQQAINSATAPVKGIVNMSLVLRDNSLLKMSLEEWNAATEPKVQGTWNLHQASLNLDLDFFLLFSSMCGIFGMPGQASYASSSSFVDAFTLYRRRRGLPASVLDLGAVEGIGYVAKNPHVLESSKLIGDVRMSQRELFDALTVAICNGLPSKDRTSCGLVNPAQILTSFRNVDQNDELWNSKSHLSDNRFATYRINTTDAPLTNETASKTNKLTQFVTSASTKYETLSQPQAADFVASQIARAIFDLLMKPVEDESEIDLSRSLSDIGLDSLAAAELRSWWKVTFGLEISVLEIMSFASCGYGEVLRED